MNISTFFSNISQQPNLDFVDVKLNCDNLLFIDPRLIESSSNPILKSMQKYKEVFWAELIKSFRAKDMKKVDYLLSGLKEPNETRLGYSFSRPLGNSVGDVGKESLKISLANSKAIQTGVLSDFADIELFIKEIGSDRISDMTTKIIKMALIEFTQDQCRIHKIPMNEILQEDIFNPVTIKWEKKMVLLPIYLGKPIIFTPKSIVRLEGASGQNIACFYRYAIRHYIANDHKMLEDVSGSGLEGKILLRDVQSAYPISKESLTNWVIKYGKLLIDYKTDYLNGRLAPLSDQEIMNIVYEDAIQKAS